MFQLSRETHKVKAPVALRKLGSCYAFQIGVTCLKPVYVGRRTHCSVKPVATNNEAW